MPPATVTASLKVRRTPIVSPGVQLPSPEASGSTATAATQGATEKPSPAARPSPSTIAAPFSESPSATIRARFAPSSSSSSSAIV